MAQPCTVRDLAKKNSDWFEGGGNLENNALTPEDPLKKTPSILAKMFTMLQKLRTTQNNYKYRDKLTTKKKHQKSLELFEPLLPSQEKNIKAEAKERSNDHMKKNIRVEVLMTKKEAQRLLSKCKEEGTLEFKDVFEELIVLPPERVHVVSFGTDSTCQNHMKLGTFHF
ncbi:hypothetical protein Cgig2_026944 [Carnegiea gigantea]|uniref:DUF7890 domain-containing protein n=1 Tax=Carnegiea gigantea TaxID=171969 RepID=A0A9Q1KY15_9CARY|nr:hypothetical protein Cgig2_026944 [Carnegiea gigantea]